MKQAIGLLFVFLCVFNIAPAYAGSGYESFPQTDYMKRKIGEDVDEQSGKSTLDRFYLWKQKSLEEQKEVVPTDETAGEDARSGDEAGVKKDIRSAGPETPTVPASKSPVMVAPGVPMPQKGGHVESADQTPFEILDHPLDEEPIVEDVSMKKETESSIDSPVIVDTAASPAVADTIESVSTIHSPEQPGISPDYVLGAGDVLEISVWKDEALSKVVPVLPDGMIQFPLLGQLVASGKTVMQLQQEIEDKMSKYMPNPFVDVSVQQVNSMVIYIIGKINRPGRYVINANVNVLQALAMAGGLNTFAKGEKIRIIRETGGRRQILRFDYDEAASGTDLSQNIRMERGDIIVVN